MKPLKKGTRVLVPYAIRFCGKWRQGTAIGTRPSEYNGILESSFTADGKNFYTIRISDNVTLFGIEESKFDVVEKQVTNKKVLRRKKT